MFPVNKRLKAEKSAQEIIDLDEPKLEKKPFDIKDIKADIIDIEEIEEKLEDEVFGPRIITIAERKDLDRRICLNAMRNPPVDLPSAEISSCSWGNCSLRAGKTVELKNGTFLQIKAVIQDLQTDDVRIRGWQLKRSSDLNGILPKQLNELCYIHEVDVDDDRPILEQSVHEVALHDILKLRRLTCTNEPFPAHRFDKEHRPYDTKEQNIEWARNQEVLVVRWKFITIFENSRTRFNNYISRNNFTARVLESLSDAEYTSGCALSASDRRSRWRGLTVLGGSWSPKSTKKSTTQPDVIELEPARRPSTKFGQPLRSSDLNKQGPHTPASVPSEDICEIAGHQFMENVRRRFSSADLKDERMHPSPEPRILEEELDSSQGRSSKRAETDSFGRGYTHGDSCKWSLLQIILLICEVCGAGGATLGAKLGGFHPVWGFDHWAEAGKTWSSNFPIAKFFNLEAVDFINLPDTVDLKVNILHISTPCQMWSPAKTLPGKNDESNYASLFSIAALIRRTKPRIVTLEQTFGILHANFEWEFRALVQMLTMHGYSVSWRLVELQKLGLASRRRRLIIEAAGYVGPSTIDPTNV